MTVAEFSQWCLNNLPEAILSDDETREILDEFYSLVGDVQIEYMDPLRENLIQTLSAENTPDVCLEGLLSLVGFSSALGWPARLSEADQRKIASLGAVFWRGKGTFDTIRALCTMLLSGNDVVFWDWPFRRYVSGDDIAAMIAWMDGLSGGDGILDLHLSDPYGQADRDRMIQALSTIKPGIDTWLAVWCLLAEPFLQGLYRWNVTGTPACEPGDGEVILAAGDQIQTSMGLVQSSTEIIWEIGRVLSEFQMDTAGTLEYQWAVVDANNYYRLQIADGNIEAAIVRDGVATVICTATTTIATGIWYLADIRIYSLMSGATAVQILIDGNEVCTGTVY